MGLSLTMTAINIRTVILSILHALGVLLIPVLITLMGGCIKKDFNNDLGPPVDCSKVESSINSSMSGAYSDVKVGQVVQFTDTITLLSGTQEQKQTVTEQLVGVTDQGTSQNLDVMVTTQVTTTSGAQEVSQQEGTEQVSQTQSVCDPSTASTVTYYNLTTTPRQMTAPTDNCDGIPNCQIAVTDITFDRTIQQASGQLDREHYVLTVSSDVPLLARQLYLCHSFNDPINGQGVPVTQCSIVTGYTYVAPTPTPTATATPSATPSPSASPSASP